MDANQLITSIFTTAKQIIIQDSLIQSCFHFCNARHTNQLSIKVTGLSQNLAHLSEMVPLEGWEEVSDIGKSNLINTRAVSNLLKFGNHGADEKIVIQKIQRDALSHIVRPRKLEDQKDFFQSDVKTQSDIVRVSSSNTETSVIHQSSRKSNIMPQISKENEDDKKHLFDQIFTEFKKLKETDQQEKQHQQLKKGRIKNVEINWPRNLSPLFRKEVSLTPTKNTSHQRRPQINNKSSMQRTNSLSLQIKMAQSRFDPSGKESPKQQKPKGQTLKNRRLRILGLF